MAQELELLLKARNLTDEAFKAVEQHLKEIEGGAKKASGRLERIASATKKAGVQMQSAGRAILPFSAAIAGVGIGAVKAAADFESSFAGVRKTVEATEEEFAALAHGFRELALEIPISVNELNRIGEAAGQLGIETENIVSFTRTMAELGITTNLSAEEAATSLARLANITQMPQESFGRLGSTIVELGNKFATTEAEIVEMSLRLAGAGEQIGLSEAQILAVGAALSSVGIKAEAGGAALSKVMIDMAMSVSEGGDQLEKFAQAAGMSAETFAARFEEDAAGAIEAFIAGLGGIKSSGGDVLAVLADLGITEVRMRDALLRLSGAGDLLTQTLDTGSGAWAENSAVTEEAAKRYETFASQLTLFWNQVKDVAITIGTELLPVLMDLLEIVKTDLIPVIRELAEWFKNLSPTMQTVVISSAALAAALGPLLLVIGSMASGIGALIPVIAALSGAIIPVTVAVAGFFAAFKAATWLLDAIPGLRAFTDGLADMAFEILGVHRLLDAYNAKQEEGVDATETWTEAQKKSLKQFKAMQEELANTAEATEKTTEAFKDMKDKVVGNSYVPDMMNLIQREFDSLESIMLRPVQHVVGLVEDEFSALVENISATIGGGLGKALGSLAGPLGALAGSLVGALGGNLIDSIFGADPEEEVNEIRDAFFELNGGFIAVQQSLVGLTDQDLVKKIFDAQTVDEFNVAIGEVNALLGLQGQAQADLEDAVKRYGFSIEELGPKFQQQELDKMVGSLLKDYELLIASGIDVNTVIEKMGPNFQEYVDTALAAGAALPESMRPVIESMIKQGLLLDENGNAFKSVEETGLSFTETLSDGLSRVIDSIEKLVAALTGIKPVNVPVNFNPGPFPRPPQGQGGSPSLDLARGGVVLPFRPRAAADGLVVASSPGGEIVRMGEGGEPELAAPVKALLATMQETALRAAGGEQRIVLEVDGRVLSEVVVRRNRAGLMPVRESSVRRF